MLRCENQGSCNLVLFTVYPLVAIVEKKKTREEKTKESCKIIALEKVYFPNSHLNSPTRAGNPFADLNRDGVWSQSREFSFWLLFGLEAYWKHRHPSKTVFQLFSGLEYDCIMCWPWFMLKTQKHIFQKKCFVYVWAFESWPHLRVDWLTSVYCSFIQMAGLERRNL